MRNEKSIHKLINTVFFRFNPMPEPGRLKGLSVILDAHNDLVSSSSVPDDYEVKLSRLFDVFLISFVSCRALLQ